ncbi:hypothetical protein CZ674_10075 [Agrococcus casei LMG 22410]|uniref:Uncharacterized protein n=1 Tax=Agrococcus casei LMG 22410 TaxID=1255656 RepID=A0A1R4G9S9_9MICO|nr:hypothetical protein CZ674_10075 [Agrococcus casei LMG 22410]
MLASAETLAVCKHFGRFCRFPSISAGCAGGAFGAAVERRGGQVALDEALGC